MLYYLATSIGYVLLKLFFIFEVRGRENVPKIGGFIIASNHLSYADPVALAVATPRKISFMARHDLFRKPLSRWCLHNLNAFPVKRNSPDHSAIKEAVRRLESGEGLLVFPEGSRGDGKVFGKPEPGVGFLSSRLGVVVIPTLIRGTENALPKGASFVKSAKIKVCFGKQIIFEKGMPYQEMAERIMDRIRQIEC